MKHKRRIEFTTVGRKSRLTGGVLRYQGLIKHNQALTQAETLKGYAAYCREPEHLARQHLEALGAYITSELERGNRLNFGWFGAGLRIGGGFNAANAPFTEGVNTLNVNLLPGSMLKKAVEALNPVNVTDETNWHICATVQIEPFWTADRLAADGVRKVEVTGMFPMVHASAADEGYWIENDAGAKVLVGTILTTECGRVDATLSGPLAPGDYWSVVQGRYKDEPALIRTRRRVKVCSFNFPITP